MSLVLLSKFSFLLCPIHMIYHYITLRNLLSTLFTIYTFSLPYQQFLYGKIYLYGIIVSIVVDTVVGIMVGIVVSITIDIVVGEN